MYKRYLDKEITRKEYRNWCAQQNGYKDRAEQKKQYDENNKEKLLEQGKQYRQSHKQQIAEYKKQYRQFNKQQLTEYQKQYRQSHIEEINEYRQSHIEEINEYHKEYGKQYYENNKEEILEKGKQYRKTPNGKLVMKKAYAKRQREFDYNILNEADADTPGYEGHHMSWEYVLYVPIWLNHMISHCVETNRNMDKVNAIAIDWYNNQWI